MGRKKGKGGGRGAGQQEGAGPAGGQGTAPAGGQGAGPTGGQGVGPAGGQHGAGPAGGQGAGPAGGQVAGPPGGQGARGLQPAASAPAAGRGRGRGRTPAAGPSERDNIVTHAQPAAPPPVQVAPVVTAQAQPPSAWGRAGQAVQQAPVPQQMAPVGAQAQPPPGWGRPSQPVQQAAIPQQMAPVGAQAQPPPGWGRAGQPVQQVPVPQQPAVAAGPVRAQAQPPRGRVQQPVVPQQPPVVPQQPPAVQAQAVGPPEELEQVQGPGLVGTGLKVVEAFQRLNIDFHRQHEPENALPKRPGYGTFGRAIRLVSNHFPLNVPDGVVYHYDVEIEALKANMSKEDIAKQTKQKATPQQVSGKRLSAAISREVMTQLFRQEPLFNGVIPAYDGNKSMFTRKPIQTGRRLTKIVTFKEQGRDLDSNFKVSIQPVTKESADTNAINLNCLHQLLRGQCSFNIDCYQAIMALDIIMRHGPSLKMPAVGRSFFLKPRNQDEVALGEGKHIWFGYYQTVRLDQRTPVLIVDKATTAFYGSGPLEGYACKLLGRNNLIKLNDFETKKLSNDLKNVQIYVTHLPYQRKYRIVRITSKSAMELKFPETQADGTVVQTSVAEYFRKRYKPLKNVNLPCVQVNPEIKKIYLPMDVCVLVDGQHYKRKLTEEQTSQMIRFACTAPQDRFNEIKQSSMQIMEDSKRYMTEFGLEMKAPLRLEGRVLDAPSIVYGNNKTIQPRDGAWDLRDTKFLRGAEIKSWAVLSMASERFCTERHLQTFADMVVSMGARMDMRINKPKAITNLGNRGLPAVLSQMKRDYQVELVVIVLRDRATYPKIKQVAEIQLGLRTSCIQAENVVKKCKPQLICNILLKMNAKFDGQNSKLQDRVMVPILRTPVLIIGVDVSHSAPGDKIRPSVAAAVGGLDMVQHHYAASIKVQKSKHDDKQHIEVIREFKDMVKSLLIAFKKHTTYKPEKIIIYRDGVSEGEFASVCDLEIPQVDEACIDLQKDRTYLPPVTFIVVQKRHHTRFAPENFRDGVGRAKNIPPGTTVDKEVIHPVNHDFFLCSHYGIQGTSRPAHYTVLRDDNNLSADELQTLSYHLCHTYARCTRSISLPAPVMYAHLAALRARQHLASVPDDALSTTSSSSDEQLTEEALAEFRKNVKVEPSLNMKMYFI